jgi:hypothetical protein
MSKNARTPCFFGQGVFCVPAIFFARRAPHAFFALFAKKPPHPLVFFGAKWYNKPSVAAGNSLRGRRKTQQYVRIASILLSNNQYETNGGYDGNFGRKCGGRIRDV